MGRSYCKGSWSMSPSASAWRKSCVGARSGSAPGTNASDVITVVDAEGTILYVSPAVKRVLGYEPEEMIGESALAFGHPDDREEAMSLLAELSARPGIQPTFELRVSHKDGSWRYLEHTANNLLDEANV